MKMFENDDGYIFGAIIEKGKRECNGDAKSACSAPAMILTWP